MKKNAVNRKKQRKMQFAKGLYSTVKFVEPGNDTKSFECIPDIWFVDETKKRCFWPPISKKSITLRAMNQDVPEEDWGCYICELVSEGHETYSIGMSIVREKIAQKYNTSSADEHIQRTQFRRKHPGLIHNGEKSFENVFASTKTSEAHEKNQIKVAAQNDEAVPTENGNIQLENDKENNSILPSIIHPITNSGSKTNSKSNKPIDQPLNSRPRSGSNHSNSLSSHSRLRESRSSSRPISSRQERSRSLSNSLSKTHIIRSSSQSKSRSDRSHSHSNRSSSHSNRSRSRSNCSRPHSNRSCSRNNRSRSLNNRSRSLSNRSRSRSNRSRSHSNRSCSRNNRSRSRNNRSRSRNNRSRSRNNQSRSHNNQSRSRNNRSRSRNNRSRSRKNRSRSRNNRSRSLSSRSRSLSNRSRSRLSNRLHLSKNHRDTNRKNLSRRGNNRLNRRSFSRSNWSSEARGRLNKIRGTHETDNNLSLQEQATHRHMEKLNFKNRFDRQSKGSGNQESALSPRTRNRIRVQEMYRQYYLQRAPKSANDSQNIRSKQSSSSPLRRKGHAHYGESSQEELQTSNDSALLKDLLKEVKEIKALVNKNDRRFIESDRRLTRLEVTSNKSFIVLGDLTNAINTRMTLGTTLMARDTKPPRGYHAPKLPIKRLRELATLNVDFENDEFFKFLVNREKEYCAYSTSTDTVTMTTYLKRFVSVDVRASLVLKELKGTDGYTLYRDFNKVYDFLIEVMKTGYELKGKVLTNNDVHKVLRTVWGRSKQALDAEAKKRK